MNFLSEEFKAAVNQAWQIATDPVQTQDDAIRYMARAIPIYVEPIATPDQAAAAGCPKCIYLGMWSERWPGMPVEKHGIIWLFEAGIRTMRGNLVDNAYEVLTHEMGHALQRDHVLDAMEEERQRGVTSPSPPRGCGCIGVGWRSSPPAKASCVISVSKSIISPT